MTIKGMSFCLLGGLFIPMVAFAWPIKDLQGFKSLTMESAAQEGVKSVQNQLNNTTDQLLKITGDLGNLNFSPQSLFSTNNNPLVGDIKPISISVPSLGLDGEAVKNTFVTQGVLNQTTFMPVGAAARNLTKDQKEAILAQQEKLSQNLAVQGVAKANVDKTSAVQITEKVDAATKMINAAKTEREATQAYAHTTAALATNFSSVVDKASANLAIVSSVRLSSITQVAEIDQTTEESTLADESTAGQETSSSSETTGG